VKGEEIGLEDESEDESEDKSEEEEEECEDEEDGNEGGSNKKVGKREVLESKAGVGASRLGGSSEESGLGGVSLTLEELSDPSSHRPISRSPPRSRSVSPASLEKMAAALNLHGVKHIVSSDLSKVRARQQYRYHSKRSTRRAGRPQGSKAKQDTRVKVDKTGVWD